jgi:hypothetical protein
MLRNPKAAKMTKVIRKNGKCISDRVCPECGRKHFHSENMCVACRNAQQKKRKARLTAAKCRSKEVRNMRVAITAARIAFEIRTLENAGFDYRKITIEQITNAQIAF